MISASFRNKKYQIAGTSPEYGMDCREAARESRWAFQCLHRSISKGKSAG
jgi:hypothetical protein